MPKACATQIAKLKRKPLRRDFKTRLRDVCIASQKKKIIEKKKKQGKEIFLLARCADVRVRCS